MWAHAGIGRYVSELAGAFLDLDTELELSFLSPPGFKERLSEVHPQADPRVFKKTHSGIYGIAEQFEVAIRTLDADLLHVPHFNIPVLSPKKLVVTIHDLIYLDPDTLRSSLGRAYARFLFEAVEKKASAIITVSEATRQALLARFSRLRSDKLFVIPEAVSGSIRRAERSSAIEKVRSAYGLTEPFVLFVGSLKPHKNIGTLIEAMRRMSSGDRVSRRLVIVGRADARHPEILKEISGSPFVRYLGEVADADLSNLYSAADLFVLPSFCEGFGLPVLEAMACGAPVLVSDRASLPEVAGNAAMTFDPERIDALSELIYNVLENKHLREKMSIMSLERAAQFSWTRTARETLRVYQKVLEL